MSIDVVNQERVHRKHIWDMLLEKGGPNGVSPELLRAFGVYGGAQGIWVDKARTGQLSEDGNGVTMSLLHTGRHYPDDFSSDGVIYHYPSTSRPRARDVNEIEATKNAYRLGLPVFVITSTSHTKRDIHLGWVVDWDDQSKQFLISFDDDMRIEKQLGTNQLESMHDEEPFLAFEIKAGKVRTIAGRQGQQRFKFQVFKRYGPQCAVCGLAILELLQAAHLIPKESKGSDDPRNGLVLCANHHVAFDTDLFGIEPGTFKVYYKESGPDAEALRIVAGNLQHLSRKPHADALKWRFDLWSQGQHTNQLQSSILEGTKSP